MTGDSGSSGTAVSGSDGSGVLAFGEGDSSSTIGGDGRLGVSSFGGSIDSGSDDGGSSLSERFSFSRSSSSSRTFGLGFGVARTASMLRPQMNSETIESLKNSVISKGRATLPSSGVC